MTRLPLLLSLLAAAFAGCVGMPPVSIGAPPSGGATPSGTVGAEIDFGAVTTVRDCDTAGGGDFNFVVTASSSGSGGG